jgi:hypothetical protein
MPFLGSLLGAKELDFKYYTDESNIIIDSLDELLYLSKTFDYKKIAILLIEIIETADFFKRIDEIDPFSEGYSIIDNTFMLNNIIDCEEFKNIEIFMKKYNEDFLRKCENLHEKIKGLTIKLEDNKLIIEDYTKKSKLINNKIIDIKVNLNNLKVNLKPIEERKAEFNIRLITKNDIICIISCYRSFKNLLFKNLHVINKEYYSPTKEDTKTFIKELYTLYLSVCKHFNTIRLDYIIEEYVIDNIILTLQGHQKICEDYLHDIHTHEDVQNEETPAATPIATPAAAAQPPTEPPPAAAPPIADSVLNMFGRPERFGFY